MTDHEPHCRLLQDATAELADWAAQVQNSVASPFRAAQQIARRLGAHYVDSRAEIGFWAPELVERDIPPDRVFLEIFTALDAIDLLADLQEVRFRRERLELLRRDEYLWGVVEGMRPGSRHQVGAFYWVTYQDHAGEWRTIHDHLAYSVPFGAFAPAEFYDINRLDRERADREYFAGLTKVAEGDEIPRLGPPANILQLHVGTASASGTLAGLTRIYTRIAEKIRSDEPLTPMEQNYVGYDAVQLMPIEPTIEYEAGPGFWQMPDDTDPDAEEVKVTLRRPDMTNWGYDIVISAMSATNPTALESGRPDELADFAAALHNFPGKPIKLIFDVVYGHADNQAIPILNQHFLAGTGMYGQNIRFRHPVTRAVLLEMQRRRVNFGADGVRVDGAQDFKYWDTEAQELKWDDEYLQEMSDVVQEVAGQKYYPWMIFEDGRPWPQEDWELSSTYRAVIEHQPDTFQWGPLTFAHNTPFLFTFWISKWWRIEEIVEFGSNWISGCANHDTLRRGTQVDPESRINTRLGDSLVEILDNAYDHPAANLLFYGCLPGVPMDFINALMRAPWSFVRNTDDRYGVKVAAEEARFLDWQVNQDRFDKAGNFSRLKDFGFTDRSELRRFMRALDKSVVITDYDLEAMVKVLEAVEPPLPGPDLDVPTLKAIAKAWMDDVHDFCNVAHYAGTLNPAKTAFNLKVRDFRRERPWLMDNLGEEDFFDYRRPVNGTVLFYGLRRAPDDGEQVLFVANMEGAPVTLTPTSLPIPSLPEDGWRVAIASPGLSVERPDAPITIRDSQGLLLTRS